MRSWRSRAAISPVTLVDSNVLLDIFTKTPVWWEWSLMQLEDAALHGPLLINDVIFAETSIRFESIEAFDAALADAGITFVPIPRPALFLAGKACSSTEPWAVPGAACCRIFLLALMLRLKTCRC